jgi:hypothetical protein
VVGKIVFMSVRCSRLRQGVACTLQEDPEDPVIRRLSDAQYDTLAERRDFDVRKNNGWRSLPIDESTFFALCAVCVRRVRCCAVLKSVPALTNWSDEQTHEICRVGERRRWSL